MYIFYSRLKLGDRFVIKVVKQAVIHCTCSRWHAIQEAPALEPQDVPYLLASSPKTFACNLQKARHCAKLRTWSKYRTRKSMKNQGLNFRIHSRVTRMKFKIFIYHICCSAYIGIRPKENISIQSLVAYFGIPIIGGHRS